MAEEKKQTGIAKPKKKRKLRLKKEVKGVLAFVLVLVAGCTLFGILRHHTKFDYKESLQEIVLTVDETNISLQEITYYLMNLEADVNETAKIYNKENPKAYWNVYLNQQTSEGYESGYVSDLAKKAVMDYCIRDNIYYKEAVAAGFTLPREIADEIHPAAVYKYETMTPRQREMSELTVEMLELVMEKEETAHRYMVELASGSSAEMLQTIFLELDVGGDLYEQIYAKHIITMDENLWENVKVGRVTINYE